VQSLLQPFTFYHLLIVSENRRSSSAVSPYFTGVWTLPPPSPAHLPVHISSSPSLMPVSCVRWSPPHTFLITQKAYRHTAATAAGAIFDNQTFSLSISPIAMVQLAVYDPSVVSPLWLPLAISRVVPVFSLLRARSGPYNLFLPLCNCAPPARSFLGPAQFHVPFFCEHCVSKFVLG